jgi:hypothetical protein
VPAHHKHPFSNILAHLLVDVLLSNQGFRFTAITNPNGFPHPFLILELNHNFGYINSQFVTL